MQVTQEALDPCQIALTIEVEQDKVVHAVDQAYREYAKYVNVPGFRRGKAPLSFVKQRVSESDVRQRTAELLVESAYSDAIKETEIEPFAAPKLELLQLELADKPFIFKAVVPLPPVVTPGPYLNLTADKFAIQVTDNDVSEHLQNLRERAAQYPVVDRAAGTGDIIVAKVRAMVEGEDTTAEPRGTLIEVGGDNIPGFDEQVIGLTAGDVKSFTLTYPQDFKVIELAGKKATFGIDVEAIREKAVPEADDHFASTVTSGRISTIEEFRAELRADIVRELERSSVRDVQYRLIDQIIESSEILFPPVMVEEEVEADYKSLVARLERENTTLESYLVSVNKTKEQAFTELKEIAERRVKIGLVLSEIGRLENLNVTQAELDETIAAGAAERKTSAAAYRAYLENRDDLRSLANQTQTNKILNFLLSSAVITEKSGSELAAPAAKSKVVKPNTRKPKAADPKTMATVINVEPSVAKPSSRKATKSKEKDQE